MNAWIIEDGESYRVFVDKTGKMTHDEVLVRVSEILFPDSSRAMSSPGRRGRSVKKTRRDWIADASATRLHTGMRPRWEKNVTDDTGLFTLDVSAEAVVELR